MAVKTPTNVETNLLPLYNALLCTNLCAFRPFFRRARLRTPAGLAQVQMYRLGCEWPSCEWSGFRTGDHGDNWSSTAICCGLLWKIALWLDVDGNKSDSSVGGRSGSLLSTSALWMHRDWVTLAMPTAGTLGLTTANGHVEGLTSRSNGLLSSS